MKRVILLISLISVSLISHAQTFTGSGFVVNNSGSDCVDITVTGLPGSIGGSFGLTQACIDINHNFDANLNITLVAPDGTNFPLSTGNGSSGNDYSNTCFSPSATTSIENGSAPFAGTYLPEGCNWNENINNGQNPNGTWSICVSGAGTGGNIDVTTGSVTFGNTTGQGFNEASDLCANATPICTLDGYYGTTSACYSAQSVSPFCGTVENNSWLQFEASSPNVDLEVLVGNCDVGDGIQFALYETTNCSSFTYANNNSSNCFGQIYPGNNPISFTGLSTGQTYYLMIDGFAGDVCDYQVTALGGVAVLDVESTAGDTICPGQSTTLSVNTVGSTPSGYNWYDGATLIGTGATQVVSPSSTTTYTVEVLGACGPLTTLTYTVTPYNPPVSFSGLPATMDCDDAAVAISADDPLTTPCVYIVIDAVNAQSGNTVTLLENGASYWGTNTLTANTIATNTFYQVSPNDPHTIELTNTSTGSSMPYEVRDCHTHALLASGTWNVGSTGTTTVTLSGTISGVSSFSSTCGSSTLVGATAFSDVMDWGTEVFDPSAVSGPFPASCDITYNWSTSAGCSGTDVQTVTVNSPHDASFSYASATYCASASDPTPTVTGSATGTFSSTAGLSINSSTGAIDLDASTPGNYTVTHTVGTGSCADAQTFDIEILAVPAADAGSPFTITCVANLGGSGIGTSSTAGLNYSWSPSTGLSSSTASNPNANPTSTTTYTVTTSYASMPSCSATDAVTVTVDNTDPTADAGADVVIDCNSVGGEETLDGSGSTAGMNYSWSTGGGNIVSGGGTNTATVDAAGTYTITVTDPSNGCSATDDATVTEDLVAPTADAGADVIIDCNSAAGQETLDGSASTAGMNYSWSTGGGNIVSGGGTNTATVDAAGTYTITVTDPSNGCSATDDATVTEDLVAPTADAGADAIIDCNSAAGQEILDGSASTAGMNYSWSTGGGNIVSGGGTNTATVDAAGTYTITVTDPSNGCSTTDDATVTEDLVAPTADAGADAIIDCNSAAGQEILDGSGSSAGMSYNWTTGGGNIVSGSSTNTATVDAVGTYTLTVTNTTNGCSATDDADVTQDFSTPTASIGAPAQIDCVTPSTTVDGSASTNSSGGTTGLTYSWSASNGGVISGSTTGASCTATAAGDYTLTLTQANGCTDTQTVTVTADASVPTAIITGNATLTCATTSITLDGSTSLGSSLSYEWQDGTSSTIGSSSTLGVSSPDTYTLIVTNTSNSCTNSTSVIVSQDITTPSVGVNGPLVVDCNNPIVTLDGSASDQGANFTYTWTDGGSGTILGAGSADTDSTSTADTYTLTVLNTSNGCSDFADITVTMDTVSPVADGGIDIDFPCGVTTVALDGSGSTGTGISYNWSGPGTITNGTSPNPDVDATGTYTLTVTGSNGCTDTDDVDVVPDLNAPVADAGSDITVTCNDLPWNVVLDGSGSDSGANINYSWSTSGSGTITGGTTTSPSVDQEGSYTLTVTNTSNSCTATSTVSVLTDTISPTADAGLDTVITCNSGLVVNLDGTNSSGTNLTYNWTTSTGTIDSQSNGSATVSGAGDYDLTVTSDNGCTDTDQVSVSMDTVSPMVVIATPDSLDCQGTPVVLDASGTTGINETYLWSDGASSNSTSVTTSGNYTLTVTNDNGCNSTASVSVVDAVGPTASFNGTPTSGNIPLNVDFTDNSTGVNLSYSWDFDDSNTSTQQNPSNTFTEMGTYNVVLVVTDANGCSDSDTLVVTAAGESVLIIPNIFSPNGDGDNDVFTLQGTNISEVTGTIFNRWGQIIYEFDAIGAGWDGRTISGAEATSGTYFYIIDAVGADGVEYNYQGPFELVR
ncbi:PKD domain-containing protein [Parvicella tangerina]|uniref:PKD domain-containing protein n=1 Tax=Parvicella tangerina TaxID=2829795 RepID=A0A916JLL1_9FLAO|nr:PKD domain-containing protein [Parvicella tangerina]CAG5079110.1 hypothetical protein CRYO30217_00859 [Parvicella tangerina]